MNEWQRERKKSSELAIVGETGIRKFQLETEIRKKKKTNTIINFSLILSLCHFENVIYTHKGNLMFVWFFFLM